MAAGVTDAGHVATWRAPTCFICYFLPRSDPASHALLRWRPDSPTLAKTEGMLRFYLAGRRPLAQQAWPAAIDAGGEGESHAGDAAAS